jgi:hypothetical protein
MTKICIHKSELNPEPGTTDICMNCRLDIIADSNGKWRWVHSLGPVERRSLTQTFNMNRLMSKLDG